MIQSLLHFAQPILNLQFFYYKYSNNLNFNNKSDKIKILRIRMAARHRQWRVVKTPLAVTSFPFFYFSIFSSKKN
jgi:hypothetical protein